MSRIAALVASRNRPDLVEAMVEQLNRPSAHDIDVFVVECGTDDDRRSSHATLWYPDPQFRGKLLGHSLLLEQAKRSGQYDYYWVLMNDLAFEDGTDPVATLVEQMEREERLAILSPTNADGGYPGGAPQPGGDWRPVSTCDYLGFLMRAEALEEVGFLDPVYEYCWGAIHELAYKLYSAGWIVGYSDKVSYEHLGGTTYGASGTNTISREEYQRRAKRFAYDHLRAKYGEEWPAVFLAATREHPIEVDTFAEHREHWLTGFEEDEQRARRAAHASSVARRRAYAKRLEPRDEPDLVRLHLGAGRDKRAGWTNVDSNPECEPDVVASVEALTMYEDGSVDVIEANHLFEHLTRDQAVTALKEWRRVLKPGGELYLECPDLERCVAIIGKHEDDQGNDLGMVGLYGWPPDIARDGVPQLHKWGWTRATLGQALREAGFDEVDFGPITQTWRPAAKYGRDLRVRAAVAGPPPLVLAWPRIDRPQELAHLFETFGPALLDDSRARLAIYVHAEETDKAKALEALDAAYGSTLGDVGLAIELLEGPLPKEAAAKLSERCVAVCDLPSLRGRGAAALSGLMAPWVADANELSAALAQDGRGATKRIALTEE